MPKKTKYCITQVSLGQLMQYEKKSENLITQFHNRLSIKLDIIFKLFLHPLKIRKTVCLSGIFQTDSATENTV